MRIGFFSDLHTEFLKPEAALTPKDRRIMKRLPYLQTREAFMDDLRDAYRDADVIVGAGDIGVGVKAVNFLADAFPDKPVIYTPGNHDYWGGEMHSTQHDMREAAAGTRVHFLPGGETAEIDGVLFCGATLWTDYDLVGSRYSMDRAKDSMNDFRKIRLRRRSGNVLRKDEAPVRLQPIDLLGFHRSHLLRIQDAMADATRRDIPLVVVTHHAPSAWSLLYESERVAMQKSGVRPFGYQDHDPFYASHLDYLMEGQDAPQVWIHGHTHIAVGYQVGMCRVVSNPRGYNDGLDAGWEIGRTIKLYGGAK